MDHGCVWTGSQLFYDRVSNRLVWTWTGWTWWDLSHCIVSCYVKCNECNIREVAGSLLFVIFYRFHEIQPTFKRLMAAWSTKVTCLNLASSVSSISRKDSTITSYLGFVVLCLFLNLFSGQLKVKSGTVTSGPSGYYYQGVWRAVGGLTIHEFNTSAITQCLKGKAVHMYGDSTVRQWFEFLNAALPGSWSTGISGNGWILFPQQLNIFPLSYLQVLRSLTYTARSKQDLTSPWTLQTTSWWRPASTAPQFGL